MARNSIQAFSLANPIYAAATVTFWTVSGGVKTSTKATLYDSQAGAGTLVNPQTLDDKGKFRQAVYADVPTIATVSGLTIADHDTGIILEWFDFSQIVTVSNYMKTLLDDTTAVTAQATLGVREVLTGNRNYYVRNDGSNSNTGLADTAGAAWLTQQYALSFIGQRLDLNGYTVTVQCTGTFAENLIVPEITGYNGNGYQQVTFKAPSAAGATMNCGVGIGIFAGIASTPITWKDFIHRGQDATNGICAEADAGGVIAFVNPTWGVASTHKLAVHNSARIIEIAGTSTINGNCTTHSYAREGGQVYNQPGLTQTISGGVTISNAYADAADRGWIYMADLAWVNTFTGIKYRLGNEGFIQHDTSINNIAGSLGGIDERVPVKTRRQPVRSADFQVWQNGTSIAASAGGIMWTAAGWFFYRGALATGATVAKQSNPENGYPQSLRLQRDNGNAAVDVLLLLQSLTSQDSKPLAGKYVTLAIRCKKGANFSPTATCAISLRTGKGTDESLYTGFTSAATLVSISLLGITTSFDTYTTNTIQIPSDVTQLGLQLTYTPVGVAGADDWIEIEYIRLDEGKVAVAHVPETFDAELERAEFFEQVWGGDDADEYIAQGAEIAVGATARFFLPYKRPMRAVPTLTATGNFEAYFPRTAGVADATALALQDPAKSRSALNATLAGTAGDVALLKAKADTTARITLRSELG